MKAILIKSGMLSVLVVLLCSFTNPSKTHVIIKPTVTNYITHSGYTFYFDVPANYCGPAYGITSQGITDGTNYYSLVSKTGWVCWDSGAGKFEVTMLKITFLVNDEEVEVIIDEGYLENSI